MIQTEPAYVYSAECDICKIEFEHPFEGWSTFLNQDYMRDSMTGDGWHIDDEELKCYCPKCHYINDDDELVLNVNP